MNRYTFLRGSVVIVVALFVAMVVILTVCSEPVAGQTPSRRTTRQPAQLSDAQKEEVLTNDLIIRMLKAGIDEDVIIAKIQKTRDNFDLSTDGLIALKQAGASSRLIQFMMDPSKPPAPKGPASQPNTSSAELSSSVESKTPSLVAENNQKKTKDTGQSNNSTAIIINGEVDSIRSFIIQDMTSDGYTLQKDDKEQLVFDKRMKGGKGVASAIFSKLGGNKLEPIMTSLTFLITKQSNKSYLVYGSMATRRLDEPRAPSTVNTEKAHRLIRKYLEKFKSQVENR